MAKQIFVGRDDELKRFREVLAEPKGQAVVVVGQAGMGKTWLVNEMAETAYGELDLECGFVRYEVTPNDTPKSIMALMIDNAFDVGKVEEKSFDGTKRTVEQWRSLLNVLKIGDLWKSFNRDPVKDTREQFLERLRLISERMGENGRALFIIDPEKYMHKDSDQDWAIVVKGLPERIKFVFAQRPGDVLVGSETFWGAGNVVRIPGDDLGVLDEEAVDELVNERAGEAGYGELELRGALGKYEGYPYALGAALDLIRAGTKLEELPEQKGRAKRR